MSLSNLLPDSDQTRAYHFAKNKRQQTRGHTADTRLEHIDEELSYWKQRLIAAPTETRETIVDRLLKLRAEQAMLHLTRVYERDSRINDHYAQKIIAQYYIDCVRLLRVVPKLK